MDRAGPSGMGWPARLLVAFALVLAGAGTATWGLAHWQSAARLLGVVPASGPPAPQLVGPAPNPHPQPELQQRTPDPAIAEQIARLQSRIQQIESKSEQAQGSAGRADALLIAFAARRAIERGVALGYLEPLLVNRFGTDHPQSVATVVTAARAPVRLSELIAAYQQLQPELVGPPPNESPWDGIRRGFSSLVTIHRSDRPSAQPEARYQLALTHLMAGEVDSALAETMRLPGAPRARDWIGDARRYIAAHRALDELESAALVGSPKAAGP